MPADALRALLAEERRALRAGAHERLAQLATDKLRLVADLAGTPPSRRDLACLRRDIARNERLLAQALAGYSGAGRDVMRLRLAAAGFASYGADGQQAIISGPAAGRLRRSA